MSNEGTAIRLASKLTALTAEGKLSWRPTGYIVSRHAELDTVFETAVDKDTVVLVGEGSIPRSTLSSYAFVLMEDVQEVFDVFAEGIPAEPTEEQREMWRALKELFYMARDSARGTKQKVERLEQLLQRLT